MALKQPCKNLFGSTPAETKASAVSLGSLAMGNMLYVVENLTEMAENELNAEPTLRPFYKEFERGRKFGPNGIERGVHKFFWEHSSLNLGLLQIV